MTPPLAWLTAAAVVWVLVHIGISGTRLRDRLVAMLGERRFRLLFSLASVANLIWLGLAWGAAGPVRVLWQAPDWLVVGCMALLVPAVILLVGSVTTPNPTMVGGHPALKSDTPAVGILRVTRYPMLWSFALWAAAHMVVIGTLGTALLTGAILVVAVAGMFSLDAKYARRAPAHWPAFVRVTSILPFAAIAQGRNHFAFAEIGLWRMVAAGLLWLALVTLHPLVYAVNPWRYIS